MRISIKTIVICEVSRYNYHRYEVLLVVVGGEAYLPGRDQIQIDGKDVPARLPLFHKMTSDRYRDVMHLGDALSFGV